MDAIGRPARIFISSRAMGKLHEVSSRNVHDENVKVSWFESTSPRKRNMLAVGTPRGIHRIAFRRGQTRHICSIYIHSIYLRRAPASRDKHDVIAGLGIHLAFHFQGYGMRNAAQAAAVEIGLVNLRIAAGRAIDEKVPAVEHEIGGGVDRGFLVIVDQLPSRFDRMHVDLRLSFADDLPPGPLAHRIGSERKLGSVRRHDRKSGDGSVSREFFLIRSIIIHRPDLFVTGAAGYEIDLGAERAGGPKYFQYVGGNLARDFSRPRLV